MTPHWLDGREVVYRVFGPGGTCLYVGQSSRLSRRLETHRLQAPWAPAGARIRVTVHPSRVEARRVETAEIRRLRPRWNISGRPPRVDWTACDYLEVIEALPHTLNGSPHLAGNRPHRLRRELSSRYPEIARAAYGAEAA